ncbi:ABC-transporter-regulating transcription factor [Exophiala dermatitidis]
MESLLRSAIPNPQEAVKNRPKEAFQRREASLPIEKDLANLVINETGAQKYVGTPGTGAASGLSMLSPRGLAWIEEKTGSSRMRSVLLRFQRAEPLWPSYNAGFHWNAATTAKHELPSKEAAIHLVNHYFDFFNAAYPLVERQGFWGCFERYYSGETTLKKSWYALLNAVLAIGCITATDAVSTNVMICDPSFYNTNMTEKASKYLQNACSVLVHVLFLDLDLTAVQAILAIAFVMQSVLDVEGIFTLVGTAARLATTLGLHQWLEGFGLTEAELLHRQRVYWIVYIMEKDLSCRIGRPSAIDDDDLELEAALDRVNNDPDIAITFTSKVDNQKFYAFKSMCSLAVIQSKVYRALYRAKSRLKTAAERLDALSTLDAELQEWKDTFPLEIRPEHPIRCDQKTKCALVVLHCGYYHCLSAIHRASAHHELWTAEVSNPFWDVAAAAEDSPTTGSGSRSREREGCNPRIQSSYALCLAAARSIVHLSIEFLDHYPDVRNSFIWFAPYFPMSALLVLFAHILQYPLDKRVDADLALTEGMFGALTNSSNIDDTPILVFIRDSVIELLNIAQDHVREARARRSRQTSAVTSSTEQPLQPASVSTGPLSNPQARQLQPEPQQSSQHLHPHFQLYPDMTSSTTTSPGVRATATARAATTQTTDQTTTTTTTLDPSSFHNVNPYTNPTNPAASSNISRQQPNLNSNIGNSFEATTTLAAEPFASAQEAAANFSHLLFPTTTGMSESDFTELKPPEDSDCPTGTQLEQQNATNALMEDPFYLLQYGDWDWSQ